MSTVSTVSTKKKNFECPQIHWCGSPGVRNGPSSSRAAGVYRILQRKEKPGTSGWAESGGISELFSRPGVEMVAPSLMKEARALACQGTTQKDPLEDSISFPHDLNKQKH